MNPSQDDDSRTVLSQGSGAAGSQGELTYLPGDIVDGKYKLIKVIGRGGMGVVFSASHLSLSREYALKILPAAQLEDESWARFEVEARALARLAHPSIVGIHNMGVDKGSFPYYVMDLLSGESLFDLLARDGRLSETQVLSLFIDVADALKSAHAKGAIHRDIKPSNLMVMREGGQVSRLKLVDFGIARLSGAGKEKQSQTATGAVFGTPFYMSPEQCQGERVDERADIYSLGCTIFEALTGSPPYVGKNSFATFMMHQTAPLPSLAEAAPNGRFSEDIEKLVAKMLAKSRTERYQTMAQVVHDLERLRAGKPIAFRNLSSMTMDKIHREREAEPAAGDAAEMETERHSVGENNKMLIVMLSLAAVIAVPLIIVLWMVQNPAPTEKTKSARLALDRSVGDFFPSKSTGKEEHLSDPESSTTGKNGKLLFNPTAELIANAMDAAKFRQAGATEEEYKKALGFNWLAVSGLEAEYNERVAQYLKGDAYICRGTEGGVRVFRFPKNMKLGVIGVNGREPVQARGEFRVKPGDSATLYTQKQLSQAPEILSRFGADSLDGLECIFDKPEKLEPIISNWHRLKNLSFFNSYVKALPGYNNYDECRLHDSDLLWIDKLRGLESLGLCNTDVHGGEVAKMSCLSKLKCLRLKRIADVRQLFPRLIDLTNIEELWFVDQGLRDSDLKQIAKLKNVRKLVLRRSLLTPASLAAFKKMTWLRELVLDRPFSRSDKEKFEKEIPGCRFEKVTQPKFWETYNIDK